MPQDLIDTGDCPITVAEIRAAMGLDTDQFDALIGCEIANACMAAMMRRQPRPIRRETWLVEADKVDVFGIPSHVGPVEYWNGQPRRRCIYDADRSSLPAARQRIIRQMLRHDDVDLYMVRNLPANLDALRAGRALPIREAEAA